MITSARQPSRVCSRELHRHRLGGAATTISSAPGAGGWSVIGGGGVGGGVQDAGDFAGGCVWVADGGDGFSAGPPIELVVGVDVVAEAGASAGHRQARGPASSGG